VTSAWARPGIALTVTNQETDADLPASHETAVVLLAMQPVSS